MLCKLSVASDDVCSLGLSKPSSRIAKANGVIHITHSFISASLRPAGEIEGRKKMEKRKDLDWDHEKTCDPPNQVRQHTTALIDTFFVCKMVECGCSDDAVIIL